MHAQPPHTNLVRGRRILVIDDHRNIRASLRFTLESEGALVTEAETCAKALQLLGRLESGVASFAFDCVLLDIRLPDGSGLELLDKLSQAGLAGRVIMISGEGTVSDAFKAIQQGAFDYIEKPFGTERILVSVARCLDFNRLTDAKEDLEKVAQGREMQGEHPRILEVIKLINRVAPTNGRVLITGESGTGKELVARAIHRQSSRSDRPLIKVNCAAIPHSLIESELFGHEKGAFTGATKLRLGVFERADAGSLFLDEIGELSLDVQAKLLRVLQNGEIQRVGGESAITVDVRLIAATNRDLGEMVQHGEFREDLYYRLNVVTLILPPLRERVSDIRQLANVLLKAAVHEHSLGHKTFAEQALLQMEAYRWPGNIRELRNVVERVAILSEDAVIESLAGLGQASQPAAAAYQAPPVETGTSSQGSSIDHETFAFNCEVQTWHDFHDETGRAYLKFVLRLSGGNVSEAARLLCLERAYLHRLMKKLGIQRDVVVSEGP